MRAIKSVLVCAGNLKRAQPDNNDEASLLMQAINNMNAPKFLADDHKLFLALLNDLFPSLELQDVDRSTLINEVKDDLLENKLQLSDVIIKKTIQLYDTKLTRHGTMIVGDSLGGKSVCWKTLKNAMTKLYNLELKESKKHLFWQKVDTYELNPKSINLFELYGKFNLETNEWTDGILSLLMKKICESEDKEKDKWIQRWLLLDGPVDTLWIESMNTVLDDNKLLTLNNGDRISLPNEVSLLFEVENLSTASPATVSRVGMVYVDVEEVGYNLIIDKWLIKFDNECVELIKELFEKYANPLLAIKSESVELVPISEQHTILSLTKFFDATTAPLFQYLEKLPKEEDQKSK